MSNSKITAELTTAKNGAKTMTISHLGKTVYLHSAYNPQAEAESTVRELSVKRDAVLICFGLGLGYHLLELIPKCGYYNKIIVIEPCKEIFEEACKSKAFFELNNYDFLSILVSNDEMEIKDFLIHSIGYKNVKKIKTFILPVYKRLFPEECKIFLNALRESVITQTVDFMTLLYRGELWQERLFENIPYIMDSYYVDIFKNALANKPLIIVGGGPSLDKNADFLLNIQGKIPILCMYTAYKALHSKGISPDFVIGVDSQQLRLESKEELKSELTPVLFYISTVDTRLLQKSVGPKILMSDSLETFTTSALKRLGVNTEVLLSGGSVACISLSLAKYMGVSEIIFVGQDLAVYPDKAHATGTYYDGKDFLGSMDKIKEASAIIEGKNGETLQTIHTFLSFKVWIEQFIRENPDIFFIDATEGGALIKGTKIMTLKQAFTACKQKTFDAQSLVSHALSKGKMLSSGQKTQFMNEVKSANETLKDLRPDLERAIDVCIKLDQIYITNSEHDQISEVERLKSELDEIDQRISEKQEKFEIISLIISKILLDIEAVKDDIQSEGLDDNRVIIRQNRLLYEGILSSVSYMGLRINNVVDKDRR